MSQPTHVAPPHNKQYRHWSVTIFSLVKPAGDNWWFSQLSQYIPNYLGCCYSEEKCPTTGRLHLQMYFCVKKSLRYGQIIKSFREEMGVEDFNLSHSRLIDESAKYCTKMDGSHVSGPYYDGEVTVAVVESGVSQGRRTDLEEATHQIKGGASLPAVAVLFPSTYVRNYKGLASYEVALHLNVAVKRTWRTTLHLFLGVPNSGKTYSALSMIGDNSNYAWQAPDHPGVVDWWRGYHGQHDVLIEEYRGQIPLSKFKQMADTYDKLTVRVSQDMEFPFVSHRIMVTSQTDWTEWYPQFRKGTPQFDQNEYDAFKSRITTIDLYPQPHPDSTRPRKIQRVVHRWTIAYAAPQASSPPSPPSPVGEDRASDRDHPADNPPVGEADQYGTYGLSD